MLDLLALKSQLPAAEPRLVARDQVRSVPRNCSPSAWHLNLDITTFRHPKTRTTLTVAGAVATGE